MTLLTRLIVGLMLAGGLSSCGGSSGEPTSPNPVDPPPPQPGPDTTPPSVPTGLAASSTSTDRIVLSWNASSDNVAVANYVIFRNGVEYQIVTAPTTTFVDAAGLAPGATHTYSVAARDTTSNQSNQSPSVTGSTLSAFDTTPPSIPTSVVATATSATNVSLAWAASTDTGGSGLKDYVVYRGGSQIAIVAGSNTYTDTGLQPITSYSYTIAARDNAENTSATSVPGAATTLNTADTTPPSVPANLAATASGSSTINVAWAASSDSGSGVQDYALYRGTSPTTLTLVLPRVSTNTFADTGRAPSTRYYYAVSARDNQGNESARTNAEVSATTTAAPDTAAPSVPTGLTATPSSDTSIQLAWAAATDTGGSGLREYVIFRNGTEIETTAVRTFTSTSLAPSTAYSFTVAARDNANNTSAQSASASATTLAVPDTSPPTVPGNVAAATLSASSIRLSWTAATDAGGSLPIDYVVRRNGTVVATVSDSPFVNTGLASNTMYTYTVEARDNANPRNVSGESSPASATTSVAADTTPPTVPSNLASSGVTTSSVTITWTASTDVGGSLPITYLVFRGAGQIGTTTTPSFTDSTVSAATAYQYTVYARDAATAPNTSASSAVLAVTTPASADLIAPTTPTNLTVTSSSGTSVSLSWSGSTDTGGSGLRDYRVYRNNVLLSATPTTTTFTDSTVAASTAYTYEVVARDNALNVSSRSNAVNVTTPATQSGLDSRPVNSSCVAPARTTGSSTVVVNRVFPSLSFSLPITAVQAPGDNSRWFVAEKGGRIRVFSTGGGAASTVIDLSAEINTAGDEEAGLLGLAFHPDWLTNGKFYVFYSGDPNSGYRIQSRIVEFTSADRNTTTLATQRVLIVADKAESNHNGGQLAFGPDGFLYASLGDGGAGDDPRDNGEDLRTLFGKIIRINVDTNPYSIPPGNPNSGNARCPAVTSGFGAGDTFRSPQACPEIYASGLRNPWRFSLDRNSVTPDLWIGDVGQGAYEEINRASTAGLNFGWDTKEGPGCHNPTSGCSSSGRTDPIAAAPRSSGLASIIGGFVYRGTAIPALVGRYLFTDFYVKSLFMYNAGASNGYSTLLASTGITAAAFAQDNSGELYLLDYLGGGFYKINPGAGSGASPVPTSLIDTGCVNPSNPTLPYSGLIPYAPNAPFWSDNAVKERWMGVPNGQNITIASNGDFTFPNGTVLVKNFRLNNLLIETRLFMKHPDGVWAGYTYEWNGAQTAATLVSGGKDVVHGSQTWRYPSEAQCLQCHTPAAGDSLGLEVGQLNGNIVYPATGRTANQIVTLNALNMLSPPQTGTLTLYPDPYGSSGTLNERARSYLHTNCANCHQPGGGTGVNFDFRYSTPLDDTRACNEAPTRGDLGIANPMLIATGNADASVVLARINRRDGLQMPPLASSIVDAPGVQLVRDWINSLSSCN